MARDDRCPRKRREQLLRRQGGGVCRRLQRRSPSRRPPTRRNRRLRSGSRRTNPLKQPALAGPPASRLSSRHGVIWIASGGPETRKAASRLDSLDLRESNREAATVETAGPVDVLLTHSAHLPPGERQEDAAPGTGQQAGLVIARPLLIRPDPNPPSVFSTGDFRRVYVSLTLAPARNAEICLRVLARARLFGQ